MPPKFRKTIAARLVEWNTIPAFRTQTALRYHLLDSFMPEALGDRKRLSDHTLEQINIVGIKPIELSEYYNVRSRTPPRTDVERVFHALLCN